MRDALNKTGRAIFYSLVNGERKMSLPVEKMLAIVGEQQEI
jgi:hypothetical protein